MSDGKEGPYFSHLVSDRLLGQRATGDWEDGRDIYVRYHSRGSMKLNACTCILFLAHMVYL
jgi:hypothetical protein